MRCFYNIKYPYLNYSCRFPDGFGTMFSIPPSMLAETYKMYFNCEPKTFFDCGAATGVIVQMAMDYGMKANGIDIIKYPNQQQSHTYIKTEKKEFAQSNAKLQELFDNNHIKIKSILDYPVIQADIAYCNGILTYFDEKILPDILSKFKNVGMLCAIHNTTEDIIIAKNIMGETLETCNKPRNIKPNNWWLETFYKNGFDAKLNTKLNAFIAVPHQK